MATTEQEPGAQVWTASGLNILLGLWLVRSPWALGYSAIESALWNSVIVGAAIAIFALVRVLSPFRNVGLSWLNFALGIWLVLSPFLLNFGAIDSAMWNAVIVGLLVLALSAWSAASTGSPVEGNPPDRTDQTGRTGL